MRRNQGQSTIVEEALYYLNTQKKEPIIWSLLPKTWTERISKGVVLNSQCYGLDRPYGE
jgi:hypothetical protein